VHVTHQLSNFSGVAFIAVFLSLAAVAAFFMVFIIIVVANRAEPDPRGLRPFSAYLFGMSFVTLYVGYSGAVVIVTSLLSFIGPHASPIANSVARNVVIGGILIFIGGGALRFHLSKGMKIAEGDGPVDGPNRRVQSTYVAAVTFVFTGVAIITFGLAIYLVFQLIGPGIFGTLGRTKTDTVRTLLDVLYVMLASVAIVVAHSRLAPSALRMLGSGGTGATAPAGGAE
jgi:hypothetical protein